MVSSTGKLGASRTRSNGRHRGGAARVGMVEALARALRQPDPVIEPFVIRNDVSPRGAIHLLVIWDRLAELDKAARTQVILDAFQQVDPSAARRVTVAFGLTSDEAYRLGYLHYALITTRHSSDPVSQKTLDQALERAGGVPVQIGNRIERRYPTRDAAELAHRTVLSAVPGPYWAIVHETRADDA